uniref:accessory gene regulator B family protein n=1 Tax=Anaerocolumna aminovalerica TaxID=1527 RepID=UPI00248B60B9
MDIFDKVISVNDNIKEEDKELYKYGLRQGLFIIINLLTTILLGYIFKNVWQAVIFMIAYSPNGDYAILKITACHTFLKIYTNKI